MATLSLIGIGSGDPRQLTQQAIDAIAELDVALVLDKGADSGELRHLREQLLARFGGNRLRVVRLSDPPRAAQGEYLARVEAWHEQRAERWEAVLREQLGAQQTAGMLVWGDPAFYDSTIRIAQAIKRRGAIPLELKVIPGISSIQLLAAAHQIALNQLNGTIHITTGRRLRDEGLPQGIDEAVVMLDGQCSFLQCAAPESEIFWGACLGSADQQLIRGSVAEVGEQIRQAREALRERKGWVMDIYLLRNVRGGNERAEAPSSTPCSR
ncbi:precorrin-6A synthase (deacetylating) [Carnimonas bestiolae]|uniref:precorrin-6A synthase (deacetylating) n=1 Tax=Carnimonas bestiolae TaxID=3402172 RepID=UPI003EDC5290